MDPPAARIERLAEAIEIMRAMWGTGSATFEGAHYRVDRRRGRACAADDRAALHW